MRKLLPPKQAPIAHCHPEDLDDLELKAGIKMLGVIQDIQIQNSGTPNGPFVEYPQRMMKKLFEKDLPNGPLGYPEILDNLRI